MFAALEGDSSEMVRLLRGNNTVTPNVREFVAYLLDRPSHRPPVPKKFAILRKVIRLQRINPRLLDAILTFKQMQTAWYERNPTKRFPRKVVIPRLAEKCRVQEHLIVTHFSHGRDQRL